MKHSKKVTLILISMFLVTQLIGLFVINTYNNGLDLPAGINPPDDVKPEPLDLPLNIVFAFIIAIGLFFLLMKINAESFLRLWFFAIVVLALALAFNAILFTLSVPKYTFLIAALIALPLAYYKIFKRNLWVHNITELLIYPGIAAVFIPILNVLGLIIILLLISLYDIWAVWHSQFMQKMAHYQIDTLRIFSGFFIPYAGKKDRAKIKKLRQKHTNEKALEKGFKKARIKVNLAILGGGDVVFPIIASGVFLITLGIIPALIITATATLALFGLFVAAQKGAFYPAMPFITIGIYIGMMISWALVSVGVL